MLANGDITFVCTRRGDLGASGHKAFGLFFLISMQNAVLRRPGTEKSRVPNFYILMNFQILFVKLLSLYSQCIENIKLVLWYQLKTLHN